MKVLRRVFALLLCLIVSVECQDQPIQDSVDDLCQGRPDDEFFRLSAHGDCRDVVRCDRAGVAGTVRLASIRCPSGLAFDLNKQICDWKAKVR